MGNDFTQRGGGVTQYSDPAAVAASEGVKARIQAAYVVAYQNPRREDQARVRILDAVKRPQMAERAEYKKPVGGKNIRGPSVRLAELAIREWGNILTETQVLHEDDKIRRVKITVTDLETNASFSRDLQVHKTVERRKKDDSRELVDERTNTSGDTVYIYKATDDELHNKEGAMISKVVRNEGLRLIPSDIIDEAMEVARHTISKKDAEDPSAARKKIIDSFNSLGVKPKDLEAYLEAPISQITPADLQDLRATFQSLNDGDTTWREIIAEKKEGKRDLSKPKTKAEAGKKKGGGTNKSPAEPEKLPPEGQRQPNVKPDYDPESLGEEILDLANSLGKDIQAVKKRLWEFYNTSDDPVRRLLQYKRELEELVPSGQGNLYDK